MKRIHILSILLIGAAIALLIMASEDLSTYGTFEEAKGAKGKVKIAGQLAKDRDMYYNPEENPNYFSFYLEDQNGEEQQVVLTQAKPQDFEMSEQVVVTGKWSGEQFVASEVLLKCPSKYKDEEIYLKEESTI